MDMRDLVSVVIPVYNGEQFVHKNIECILNQTYDNLEIIYICDGCTDKTVDILQEYASLDSRIKLHVEWEKHGAAHSRNIGMGMAGGDWIIFLDCDDLFEMNMVETMVSRALQENADLCCCYWEEFDEEPVSGRTVANDNLKRYCNTYPIICVAEEKKYILQLVIHAPWNKLIHKTVYRKADVYFQDLPNNNDTYFSFSSAVESTKIVYVDEVFVHYRSSKGRKALSEGRKSIKNYVWEAYDEFYQYIDKKDDSGELKQSFYNRVCTGIFSLAGCALYEDLYRSLHDVYFRKWGMRDFAIQDILSYVNREIYTKICSGDLSMERPVVVKQAKAHFIRDIAKKNRCSLWGCGYRMREFLEELDFAELGIEHLYDSDPNKWGTKIACKSIERFDGQWDGYIIVTCPQYYEEIKRQVGDRARGVFNLEEEIFMY